MEPQNLIFKTHHEHIANRLGSSMFEVRERAIELCTYSTFKNLKLLHSKSFEESPYTRASAAWRLDSIETMNNIEETLNLFKHLLHKEKENFVKSRIIMAMEPMRCKETLDFLNDIRSFDDSKLETRRLQTIETLKGCIKSANISTRLSEES